MHILHTAVRMPRDKKSAAAARVGRACPNAKARRAIEVDRLLPRRMSLRELAAAAVPAGRCKALYAAGYAGYVEPRGGGLPYSV